MTGTACAVVQFSYAKSFQTHRHQVYEIKRRIAKSRLRAGIGETHSAAQGGDPGKNWDFVRQYSLDSRGSRSPTLIYVVDASVVVKWFLPEPDNAAADFLLEQFLNGETGLIAPDLLLVEFASSLWKRVVLRKELTADEATLVYRDLLTMPLSLIATETLAEAALQWAIKHKHPVYDALYCTLAIDRQCDFVTADQTMLNKFRGDLPFVRHLSMIKP